MSKRQAYSPPGIARVIRSLRHACGLTQQEIAERVGVHPTTWSCWERGATRPSAGSTRAVARAMSIEPRALLNLRYPIAGRSVDTIEALVSAGVILLLWEPPEGLAP